MKMACLIRRVLARAPTAWSGMCLGDGDLGRLSEQRMCPEDGEDWQGRQVNHLDLTGPG